MFSNDHLIVDFKDKQDGVFKAKTDLDKPSKLRVQMKIYSVTYTINNEFQTFPFQFGDGMYEIKLYRKAMDNKYMLSGSFLTTVNLSNPQSPYLHSNQYVNYSDDDMFVKFARLAWEKLDKVEAVEKIKTHMSKYFYDYIRAVTIKTNTLPDLQHCFSSKSGICQDLAGLAVALMRSIEIPAQLVIGYVNNQYHAWVSYYMNDKWMLYDPTAVLLKKKYKESEYMRERWY